MVHLCFGAASNLCVHLSMGSIEVLTSPPLVPGKTKGWSLAIFPGWEGRVKEILLWSTGFLEKWVQVLGSLPSLVIFLLT